MSERSQKVTYYVLFYQTDDNEQSSNLRVVTDALGHIEVFEKINNAKRLQTDLLERHEQETSIAKFILF